MKIAVLNIGYADGYSRVFSNKAKVLVKDKICDVVGNVCMDSCMIDVTKVEDIKISIEFN